MRLDVPRSCIVFCALLAATLAIALGSSTSPTAATESGRVSRERPFHGKTMLVGIVLPEGCLPGHTCSASLVTNPDDFADTPGIAVREIQVPDHRTTGGHATLRGLVVATNLEKDQPAAGPIAFKAPERGSPPLLDLTVAIAELPNEIVDVPVGQLPPERTRGRREHPSMPPIVPDSGVLIVRDRFTGDSRETQIKVNGSEVPSLAQSQSVLAIAPREALHSGKNDVEITNGGRTTYYEAWNPDVSIDADKTTLEQGESTQFRVKVKLGVIPHSYWSPDGKILLTIKNDSETTTSISGGDYVVLPLQESDFVDGTYTHSGTITAKQPGPIQIEASTSSQLEDAPPTRTETRATPTPTERHVTPIATETPRPSERTPNEEETPIEPPVLGPPVIYVPGTPVPNAPECCVITGVTITNTSNERVFYILNGSYVAGMSPPTDQWVDPGQSRTFKSDFGECVRIEAIANRGEDENGRPLTGIFVDQTVCCKDILTGTARLKGIAVKVDSIEWREWKNCPEKTPVPVAPPPPLLLRRTPTPTPVKVPRYKRTPTATSTPTETSTETETPTPVPYTPETPIIYRPGETPLCCGITGNRITYPITSDPMAVPTDPAAPRDVAAAGYQVLLHNGAFFQNEVDLSVNAVAFPMEWTRHWRGKLTFQDGGVIGDGWDFSYNKRIVPISEHRLANGLFAEQIGVDKAQLVFYNGGDQAESEKENHSENRDVFNFDTHFQAYVTTYEQSPGMFHEIERYILTPSSPHPFAGHVNVEPNERLFYVLREKNGVRYVFNCRGQLIYILPPHDSASQHVRVELQYLGPISPLTQNPTLSKIIDPSGHEFTIDTTYIHQGGVFTNYKCQLKQGSYPVPRIKRISGVGLTMEYNYRGDNSEPILESATLSTYDSTQTWKYTYDSSNRLVSEKLPNESAKGDTGQAYFVNQYDGNGRVFNQTLGCGASATKVANSVCAGDIKSTIDYAGSKITVTDAAGGATDYVLQYIGPYPVIQSMTVRDPGGGDSWTTRFEHNVSTQLTRQINPRNNGLSYLYDIANDSVTLGPIRDWVGHYTYEHDLAYGNLKSVSLFTPDQKTITATNTYEKLYNQIETTKDPLGNVTTNDYEYAVPGNRGNPVTVHSPPVAQPDGGSAPAALTKYTYTPRGQRETVEIFMEPQSAAASLLNLLGVGANKHRITTYRYDDSGYLKKVYFPGGAVDTYENTNRGEVKEQSGNGGTVTYARNGRGLVVLKTVGPYDYKIWTRFDYDLNDNITDTTLHVEDAFRPDAAQYGVYDLDSRDRVLHTDYDVLKRPTGKTTKADGKTLRTADEYGPTGQLETKRAPAFSGTGEFVTTFKYDSRGLVTYETQAANTKAAITTHNVYDENGNVKQIETSGGGLTNNQEMQYDYFDRLSSKTDLLGSDYVFEYDSLGNVVHAEVSGSPGVTGEPNAEGCSASSSGEARQLLFGADYKFDAYRHLIYKSIDALGGGRGAETRWFYDGNLQLVKQKSPAGGDTSFQYNDAGHVVHVTDPAGNETVNVYDKGNLASIEETDVENIFDPNTASYQSSNKTYVTINSYDAVGRLTLSQAPASTQRFFYDSAGEVRGVMSSTDGLTLFRYDGFGRRIKLTHGDTGVTKTYTDGDLVDEETATTGNGTTVTSHEQFQYDAMGRTLKRKDLLAGQESTFKYDGLGREYLTIDPNSTAVHRVFNDGGLATTVTIDAPSSSLLGRKANGMLLPGVTGINSEAFNYDGLGRVVCADADQPFFEHGQSMRSEVRRSYDGLGRVLTETQASSVLVKPSSMITIPRESGPTWCIPTWRAACDCAVATTPWEELFQSL